MKFGLEYTLQLDGQMFTNGRCMRLPMGGYEDGGCPWAGLRQGWEEESITWPGEVEPGVLPTTEEGRWIEVQVP